MTTPAIVLSAETSEKPLNGAAKFTLVASAALVIALFYGFALVSILVLLVLLLGELMVFVALLRFGLVGYITPMM